LRTYDPNRNRRHQKLVFLDVNFVRPCEKIELPGQLEGKDWAVSLYQEENDQAINPNCKLIITDPDEIAHQ
jgi:hypothetical protein